jgi:hypothetical protein
VARFSGWRECGRPPRTSTWTRLSARPNRSLWHRARATHKSKLAVQFRSVQFNRDLFRTKQWCGGVRGRTPRSTTNPGARFSAPPSREVHRRMQIDSVQSSSKHCHCEQENWSTVQHSSKICESNYCNVAKSVVRVRALQDLLGRESAAYSTVGRCRSATRDGAALTHVNPRLLCCCLPWSENTCAAAAQRLV